MKRSSAYIPTSAVLLAAALLGASCTKTVVEDGNGDTNAHEISLSVSEGAMTRALVDNTNFGKDGNRIQVYDFWTDGSTTSKYIDALAGPEVVSNSAQHVKGTTWPFVDKVSGDLVRYNWTSTGTHKFFGWYAKDATTKVSTEDASGNKTEVNMTAESFFGSEFSFDENFHVLTIPAKTLDGNTPQFDFLYSDIQTVDVTKGVPSNVPFSFSHLFAAVSFGAVNKTASEVKLLEFTVEKLHNTRSATIDFSGSTPSVEYADGIQGGVFKSVKYNETDTDVPVVPKEGEGTMNNIFGIPNKPQEFTLVWPQTISMLHSGEVYIKFSADGQIGERRFNLPEMELLAGVKYSFTITFTDISIELTCEVNPWNCIEDEIIFN